MEPLLALSLLFSVAQAASIEELGLYNSTESIMNHLSNLSSRCPNAMDINPVMSGVSYPAYGDITLPVVQMGTGPFKMLLNFGTYGREYGEPF